MKVAIVGSRDFGEIAARVCEDVQNFVSNLAEDTTIISGGARGVDMWAEQQARVERRPVQIMKPDWKPNGVYDNSAGIKRNALMVDEADVVVAFWDGVSKGTEFTITMAHHNDKLLMVYRYWIAENGGLL